MEKKKNKKYDLEQRRPMFFGIGMIISLSLALVAFEWKSEIDPVIIWEPYEEPPFIPTIIPPTQIDPPPPPPKAIEIVPVENDEPLEDDIPIIDAQVSEDEPVEVTIPDEDLPVEVVEEAPVNWASEMPRFEGGMEKFYKFMGKNIKYPRRAQQIGVEGRVFVQFVVEKDGSLSDIRVVKGIGAGCDQEAIRVLQKVPKFSPGKQRGKPVKVRMQVPILFRLN